MSDHDLESLGSPNPDWSNHDATNERCCSFKALAMVDAGGDWKKIQASFLSLLATPGSLITCRADLRLRLVLASSAFGFSYVRANLKNDLGQFHVNFDGDLDLDMNTPDR